ncbi:MAG TPA: Uma2 family endonuclease [Vicinamibacterales bacterium]|nr:Uma2 family endonuclease [Vicinamibacterales bacterium]
MTTYDYLTAAETMRRRELVYGMVREPPAPIYGHQSVVTGLTTELSQHARRHRLGRVCVSPIDVVLNESRGLIVQPDVIFVSNERLAIIRKQVWGAPDLVVEVLSRGTRRYDRTTKLEWYREYGVRECWIADPRRQCIEVIAFTPTGVNRETFESGGTLQSSVLTRLRLPIADAFSW